MPLSAPLESSLNTENAALQAFIALLRDEQRALVRGELERVVACTDAKNVCLFELARLGEQRRAWLRERGQSDEREGMQRALRDADASTLAEWHRLLELAKTARQLNDINGALIGTRLNGAQRALGVLFSAANIAGAYAPDGSTVCARATHHLAVA